MDPTPTPITVMLVGDCPLIRSGYRQVLEGAPDISVVASAADAVEAVGLLRHTHADVIISGAVTRQAVINDLREIVGCYPGAPILMLGQSSAARVVRAALAAGARGYVLLPRAHDADLIEAVRVVAGGGRYLSPELPSLERVKADDDPAGPRNASDRLTERERQVLTLVAAGRSSREIATMLGVSANTVAVHRANLMKALKVRKVAGLVLFAVRHGFVTADSY